VRAEEIAAGVVMAGLTILTAILVVLCCVLIALYFHISSILSKTDNPLEVWEKLAETPFLNAHVGRIFTYLVKVRNPFSKSICTPYIVLLTPAFHITTLEIGRCEGILFRRKHSDGPIRCTHGVALTLFAETLAGLAVFTRLGTRGRGILLKSETEYIKKAKGMARGRSLMC
jgi:Domain of unknown function (DUF4442)